MRYHVNPSESAAARWRTEGQGAAFDRARSILSSVADTAGILARAGSWTDHTLDAFAILAEAAGVERIGLYRNEPDEDGWLMMRRITEWRSSPAVGPVALAGLDGQRYEDGFDRWARQLAEGGIVAGRVASLPAEERAPLRALGTRCVVILPIITSEGWWGFLSFEDRTSGDPWVDVEVQALRAATAIISSAIEREAVTTRLTESESRLRTHVERIPAITYIEYTDLDNLLGYSDVYVSPQIEAILGYPPSWWLEDVTGAAWNDIVHPDDVQRLEEEARRTALTKEPYAVEYRVRRADGAWAWIRDEAFLFDGEGGRPYWHGVMIDITDRKEMEEQLARAEERYRTLVEQIPAALYVDPIDDEQCRYVSPQIEHILGCSPNDWLTPGWWQDHIHPDERDLVWERHEDNRALEAPQPLEYRMIRADGREVWVREEPRLIRRDDGSPWMIQGLLHDITERRLAQKEIEFLAYHDRLTGLANRAQFEVMLEPALSRARRRDLQVAVLFMDLDGFKGVNDAFGHHAGDQLLVDVARRLTSCVRDTDTVARQGGDEFLVLLTDVQVAEGEPGPAPVPDPLIREIVARIEHALEQPFALEGKSVSIGISVGVSVFPADASDARTLLMNADSAMYAQKQQRRAERAA